MPLATAFAEAGLDVVGVEADPAKIAALNAQDSYVEDAPAARLAPLLSSGRLKITDDYAVLREAEAIVICLPTPLNEHREPDLSILVSGMESVAGTCRMVSWSSWRARRSPVRPARSSCPSWNRPDAGWAEIFIWLSLQKG